MTQDHLLTIALLALASGCQPCGAPLSDYCDGTCESADEFRTELCQTFNESRIHEASFPGGTAIRNTGLIGVVRYFDLEGSATSVVVFSDTDSYCGGTSSTFRYGDEPDGAEDLDWSPVDCPQQ